MTRFYQGIYYDNLGMSYSGGTFTILGADGRSLSSSNPGVVVIPSKSTPGVFVEYQITADQSFEDAAGTSDITNNLFGTTTSIAWAQDCPFFIYAVANNAEDSAQFMISRIPHATSSPSTANIGAPDDAVADTQGSFWSLSNIDETLYDENPCVCLGSFVMQKDASDDWTVQTLSNSDGFNRYQEDVYFTYPTNQNSAAVGTHWISNAGTEPQFATEQYAYKITKSGYIWINCLYDNCNVAGVGSQTLSMSIPLEQRVNSRGLLVNIIWVDASASNAFKPLISYGASTDNNIYMYTSGGTAFITNANFASSDDFYMQGWLTIGFD